jgi:hypothetical protein
MINLISFGMFERPSSEGRSRWLAGGVDVDGRNLSGFLLYALNFVRPYGIRIGVPQVVPRNYWSTPMALPITREDPEYWYKNPVEIYRRFRNLRLTNYDFSFSLKHRFCEW